MSDWNFSRRRPHSGESVWSSFSSQPWTLQATDICLFLILLGAPWFMGGRQAFGQLVLCILSTLTCLLWAIHQWWHGDGRWRFTGAEPVILIGLGLVIFQVCPIPPDLLAAVSPKQLSLLPMWQSGSGASAGLPTDWNRVSLTPYVSLSNLVVIVACAQFFFVAVQRTKTVADLTRLLHLVAGSGALMAGFGIAQFLAGNGKFFWIYEHPMTDTHFNAKGAFTNANHFANFLAMTLPAQLFLLAFSLRKEGRPATSSGFHQQPSASTAGVEFWCWLLALGVTGTGILLSMSRGGIVFSLFGVLVCLGILWKKSLLSTRITSLVCGLAVACLLGTMVFGDLATKMIEQNFHDLVSTDVNQLDQNNARRKIWEANLDGIREFPLVGTGLGSHNEVYWIWFPHPHNGMEYSHAENGYLQVALETGLIGLGVVLLLWMIALLWCAQGLWNSTSAQSAGILAAATAGLLVSLAHSIADFVWYVPACMNIVLVYAVCAWRISLMRFVEEPGSSTLKEAPPSMIGRWGWLATVPCVLGLGMWMVQSKIPEVVAEPMWQEYVRLAKAQQRSADEDGFDLTKTIAERRNKLATAAAAADPRDHRLQLHAGLACLKEFSREQEENGMAMPLAQLRDAARVSFSSQADVDAWLNQPELLGESRRWLQSAATHFRMSLAACPLQPRPYLELADLLWLEVDDENLEESLIAQAVKARPYDARSQFALGRVMWLNGSQKEALSHWQQAFRIDAAYRGHLISALSLYVPARFFLEQFDLEKEALTQLRVAYRKSEDQTGYRDILRALATSSALHALESDGLAAEEDWLLAHECFHELGDSKKAYHAAKGAIAANPSSFRAHQTFGLWLYHQGVYREAVEHLTWCYRRKPDVEWLHTMAEDAFVRAERGDPPPVIAEAPQQTATR